MTHPANRRLLGAQDVSVKLGRPHGWFDTYRANLEAIGFPAPCLSADDFGGELWDERAIDLWLDARMDPALRPDAPPPAGDGWNDKLIARAREMHP